MIDEELRKTQELNGDGFDTARYGQAVALFTEVAFADSFAEFGDAARVRAHAVGRGTALWSRWLRHPPQKR
jgi:hypothetical protein